MTKNQLNPIDVAIQDARNRSQAVPFKINALDISTLLMETVQLAKLSVTEARDIEAIRSDFTLRSQKLKDIHEEIMFMIEKEYTSREQQTSLIHENVKLLIGAGQYQIAQQILDRLAEILADSPLKNAMNYRIQNL